MFCFVGFINAGHNYSYKANGSDYYLTFSYSAGYTNFCSCSNYSTYVYGRKTSHSDSNVWFGLAVGGTAGAGSTNIAFGPSQTRTFYTTWHYSGRKPYISCVTDVECKTTVNSNNPVTASTAAIKKPTNVQASDDVSDNYIDITWDKATDIPEADHRYKIYQNTTLIATLAGTVRS
ncbi:hypothetical protein OAD66_04625 [Bacteroidia bacterium]|nr:hypothetical protein [Bacteroidia bacterium]MDB9882402.1 hypothetical protein [Bacteroidia bacterium]